jgi:hypothetical protein
MLQLLVGILEWGWAEGVAGGEEVGSRRLRRKEDLMLQEAEIEGGEKVEGENSYTS